MRPRRGMQRKWGMSRSGNNRKFQSRYYQRLTSATARSLNLVKRRMHLFLGHLVLSDSTNPALYGSIEFRAGQYR